MEYGALTLMPVIVIIVMAVITKKSFESLIVGSITACIIMYGVGFIPEWVKMVLTAASDYDNVWVILVCGLFGSLIAMLRESKGTNGFSNLGEKLCKSEKTALLGTFIMGAVIFVDDIEKAPLTKLGPIIEHHEAFPDGVNVEFVEVL